jgi:hypothetical protein
MLSWRSVLCSQCLPWPCSPYSRGGISSLLSMRSGRTESGEQLTRDPVSGVQLRRSKRRMRRYHRSRGIAGVGASFRGVGLRWCLVCSFLFHARQSNRGGDLRFSCLSLCIDRGAGPWSADTLASKHGCNRSFHKSSDIQKVLV